MKMSENAESTTWNQLTLFAEDSLASLTVLPGSAEALKMTAISGQNIAALLPNSDPAGCLARMFLASEPPSSIMCYLTWKVLTTPQSRLIFQLSPSVPDTGGTDILLWPTPRAAIGMNMRLTEGMADLRYKKYLETEVAFQEGAPGGTLNPMWIEWLMGFPIGWTDLEHLETP